VLLDLKDLENMSKEKNENSGDVREITEYGDGTEG
jgi:hypothetical protein